MSETRQALRVRSVSISVIRVIRVTCHEFANRKLRREYGAHGVIVTVTLPAVVTTKPGIDAVTIV